VGFAVHAIVRSVLHREPEMSQGEIVSKFAERLEFMRLYTKGTGLYSEDDPFLDIAWHPENLCALHAGDPKALRCLVAIVVAENEEAESARRRDES
jgi:hypothetical protein